MHQNLAGQGRHGYAGKMPVRAFSKSCSALIMLLVLQAPGHAAICGGMGSMEWLLGDWVSENDSQRVYESWKEVSARTWEGMGKTESKSTDSVLSQETLRLVEMSGELFYLAKVAANEFPVPFKLTDCAEHMAVFENSQHDFPKAFRYRLSGRDQMEVRVSGAEGQGFELHFSRKKVYQPIE
ncbi:MAG: hypothetical protein HKN85_02455 [Gammaproteobacteria bacterium]|nr:hypothetical protein [Gammaproteobacteria bacterium]